jgi:hypothetical protein
MTTAAGRQLSPLDILEAVARVTPLIRVAVKADRWRYAMIADADPAALCGRLIRRAIGLARRVGGQGRIVRLAHVCCHTLRPPRG